MVPRTRSMRTPVWDSCSWLRDNYHNHNGLPKFFDEGGYSYDLKKIAEEDYKYSVDEAVKSSDEEYSQWAENIKNNEYSPLAVASTREFWKAVAQEEVAERKRKKLNDLLLEERDAPLENKRQRRTPPPVNDLMYLDGVRGDVGTVIKTLATSQTITDRKSNYFKTLAMNHIIDISDTCDGSHLDLFDDVHQQEIVERLSSKRLNQSEVPTTEFERIIDKFSNIEDDDRFLRKTIKEIDAEKNGDKIAKKTYLRILESMQHDKYLYDPEDDSSEADFINKLHSPIMEACFQGCGFRLRWGDTVPDICKKSGYTPKIDLRVTIPSKIGADVSAVEFAKTYRDSKYYKDKVKIVLCSLLYLRETIKKGRDNVKVPSMIISRLEGEMLILHAVESGWFVLQKVADVDSPLDVKSVKRGDIKKYFNDLKYFKDYCIDFKDKAAQLNSSKSSKKKHPPSPHQKALWLSEYESDEE